MRSLRTAATLIVAAGLLFTGCGGGGGSPAASTPPPPTPTADITLLFMGNSHTAVNDVPGMVAAMVRAARPGKTVAYVLAPASEFLDEHVGDTQTLALLRGGRWSFVVLQAQRYSSSGTVDYPIDGAVALVQMARTAGAVPILFAEWPRRGIPETQRIYDLYASIAMRAPACVAPIPQAFDLALARDPGLVLHAADGNHSSGAGAFLAALVIAATMTGAPPGSIPFLSQFPVDEPTQAGLRTAAGEALTAVNPRLWCPGD